ncbi:hypothetical protein [uncultured Lamprocystis sp.]|nr:hypothetical protein [uncultured Lamprocystis sp.]
MAGHNVQRFLPASPRGGRIARADPETLLSWSQRIRTADRLDAVLH